MRVGGWSSELYVYPAPTLACQRLESRLEIPSLKAPLEHRKMESILQNCPSKCVKLLARKSMLSSLLLLSLTPTLG